MSWSLHLEEVDDIGNDDPYFVDGCTYNLSGMFRKAGVFDSTSRELDGMKAFEVGHRAARGLLIATNNPRDFEALNPGNGWGDYQDFLQVLLEMAVTCNKHPEGICKWYG